MEHYILSWLLKRIHLPMIHHSRHWLGVLADGCAGLVLRTVGLAGRTTGKVPHLLGIFIAFIHVPIETAELAVQVVAGLLVEPAGDIRLGLVQLLVGTGRGGAPCLCALAAGVATRKELCSIVRAAVDKKAALTTLSVAEEIIGGAAWVAAFLEVDLVRGCARAELSGSRSSSWSRRSGYDQGGSEQEDRGKMHRE